MPAPAIGTRDLVARSALLPSSLVGSLTLPGLPKHVSDARRFVARAVGDDPRADSAMLLTSELVTNALMHSRSRLPGGRIVVVAVSSWAGLLVSVTDDGSDSGLPVVGGRGGDEHGNGLLLVDTIADRWGYLRNDRHTTVWFRLSPADHAPDWDQGLLPELDPPGQPRVDSPHPGISGAAISARVCRETRASPRARQEAGSSPPSPRPRTRMPSADRGRSGHTEPACRSPCFPPIPW